MKALALGIAGAVVSVTMSFAQAPLAATPQADLVLVTYVALYQGNAPISSSGGLTMTSLGTYKSHELCMEAQSRAKIAYVRKGSSDSSFATGNALNWGVMCIEKNP